jgi:Rieske Fe-S protein
MVTRKRFLKWLIAVFGLASLAGALYPVVRFLKPPTSVAGALGQAVNVGSLSKFPPGQFTPVTVNGLPAVVRNVDNSYEVLSMICTHLGCVVAVHGNGFHCPCHGSDYAANGTVTHGPAKLPLPPYHTTTENGSLLVGAINLSAHAYPDWYKGEFQQATADAGGEPPATGWFARRLGLVDTMEDQYNRVVPAHATNYIYCFGGIAFVLFVILAITGILLAVYYQPQPKDAYASVLNISTHVQFGWWIRSIHVWAAGGMVLLVFVHALRVFFTGAYKAPRELNWLSGVVLLLITLGFGFTGYLLPWDQKAYWATKVGTDIAGSVPLVGHFLLVSLRGGEQISAATLGRFYDLHVLVLPALIALFLLGHFWMIRRHGISGRL